MHTIKTVNVTWNLHNSIRIKAFIINSNNELLLGISNGGCQLPGGHLEKGEQYQETLIREIKEETGIELNLNYKPKPFFEVAYRNNELCSRVLYFFIHTDLSPDLNNTNYTRAELENNFTLRHVPLNDFEAFINKNKFETQEPINKVIDDEILEAFKHLPL